MQSTAELLVEQKGQVAVLTLNRPDTLNALTMPMVEAVLARLDECNDDPEVRVVIITGAGRGFCSGFDLKAGNIADAKRK